MRHSLTLIPLSSFVLTVLTLNALVACGESASNDDTSAKPIVEGNPNPIPTIAGPSGPSGTPVPKVTTGPSIEVKSFEFDYEGVPGPIKGTVSAGDVMKLLKWPEALTPKIHLVEPANQTRFTEDYCDTMRTVATNGRADLVRRSSGYTLFIEVLAPAGIKFNNSAVHAATVALAAPGAPRFEDKPVLVSAIPRVILRDGALTAIIGDIPKLEEDLANRLRLNTSGAWVQGEIFATDLMCDLKSGKAAIEYKVTTNNGYTPSVIASEVVNSP